MRGLIATLVLFGLTSHLARAELDRVPLPRAPSLEAALPSLRALDIVALGYRSLTADYYFLKALDEFGNTGMHEARFPNLIAFVRRALHLDPYYATAYFFAGTALTVKELDSSASIELLQQGLRYRPDDWRIAFLLGFNAYYFANDYALGARALAQAARHPEAPSLAGPLATRLAAQSDSPEIGIDLIDSISPGLSDEALREEYAERRRLLVLERDLRSLNRACVEYVTRNGRSPRSLEDLVAAGLVAAIPPEPLGGRYFLGAGRVETTNEARRLRLHPQGLHR
jgi:tetratricopeptide (TPR) repeat protein